MRNDRGWDIPTEIDDGNRICVKFEIPDQLAYRAAVTDTINALTKWINWQKGGIGAGDTRATQVGQLFKQTAWQTLVYEDCEMDKCCCDCGDTIINIASNNNVAIDANIALVDIYIGNPSGWLPDVAGPLSPAQQAELDDYICTALSVYIRATIGAIEASIQQSADDACNTDSWVFRVADGLVGIAQDAWGFVGWGVSQLPDINGWLAPIAKSAEGWQLIGGLIRDTLTDVFGGDACEVQVMPMADDAINQYICQVRDVLIGQPLTYARWQAGWDTLQSATWDYSVWPYATDEENESWQQMLSAMLTSSMSSIEAYVEFTSLLDNIISGDRPGYSSAYCPCDDGCSDVTSTSQITIFAGMSGAAGGIKVYPAPVMRDDLFGGKIVATWTAEQANAGITFILPYSREVCLSQYNGDLYRTSTTASQPSQLTMQINGQDFTQPLFFGDEVDLFYNVIPDQPTVYFKLKTNPTNNRSLILNDNFRVTIGE